MPISELTIPDRGDRPEPPRPLEDDPEAVTLRKAHVSGEAIVQAIARIDFLAGLFLLAIVAVDLLLITLFAPPSRPVFSVGANLAVRGQLERTPRGIVPKTWPASPHPTAVALVLGGVTGSMAAVGSLLIAIGFGLSRLRPWARWLQAATILLLGGSTPFLASSMGRAFFPSPARQEFEARLLFPFLSNLGFVFVGATIVILWLPAVRFVFRPEYRRAVALSPRLRTWRTGRNLHTTILVGLLGFALFGLIVFGPLGVLGDGLMKEALRRTYEAP